ncbi:MAG: GNAT family N-acetyltransferase [Candidatus Latescibacterota bacterium]|nr:MAG: GNAT family N-acetyltransferase [Candidatus Latescibacterota bacterium]
MKIQIGAWQIRSYEARDLDALLEHANNRKVSMHLREAFPYPYTHADARHWLQLALSQRDVETHFAIAKRRELIGGIGFQPQEDVYRKSAEIGYWLAEPYWGQGIATVAVRAMTEYAFRHFDLARLYANVFEGNPASERVLEKVGYVYEGTMRQAVFKENRLRDQKIYAILRADFANARRPDE